MRKAQQNSVVSASERRKVESRWLFSFNRHCEERSDEAICLYGLLRCARNDGVFI